MFSGFDKQCQCKFPQMVLWLVLAVVAAILISVIGITGGIVGYRNMSQIQTIPGVMIEGKL